MRFKPLKKSRYFLMKDDRGASLIAVIVALIFVTTMGAIIMEVTTTNSRISEFELFGKENFYSADEVMENVKRAVTDAAAQEMQDAYTYVITNGGSNLGGNFQAVFSRKYMEELEARFKDTSKPTDTVSGSYTVGSYQFNAVQGLMPSEYVGYVVSPGSEGLKYIIDYEEGTFTLKNLTVHFTEEKEGYDTWIVTDIVLHTPTVQFDDVSSSAFTEYSLIADTEVEVTGATSGGLTVKGNVYAGGGGIVADPQGNVTFNGANIVTRGDIVVMSGAKLEFVHHQFSQKGMTYVWAENIRTEGSGEAPTLILKGVINVADDLEINGDNSVVTLEGYYNGYNFRETYDSAVSVEESKISSKNSEFSSAIMINGKNCDLNMSALTQLFLAGRTFIKRGGVDGNQGEDIWLGESLSVRSDQLAYYVSDRYLEKDLDGNVLRIPDDVSGNVYATFSDDGWDNYKNTTLVDLKTAGYLVSSKEVVEYKYKDSTGKIQSRYYLNFKDEESANGFFKAYWEASQNNPNRDLSIYGKDYAYAIQVGDNTLLTLRGDLLTRTADGDFILEEPELNLDAWKSGSLNWQWADMLARTYKSFEEDLAGDYSRVNSADVRSEADPLFENLIDKDRLDSLISSDVYSDSTEVKIIDAGEDDTYYEISNEGGFKRGIVIAKGNVLVTADFTGIIIAEGNVELRNGFEGLVVSEGTIKLSFTGTDNPAAGVSSAVTSDSKLVQEFLLKYPEIALVFRDYQQPSGLRIGDYVTYENWTKNEE